MRPRIGTSASVGARRFSAGGTRGSRSVSVLDRAAHLRVRVLKAMRSWSEQVRSGLGLRRGFEVKDAFGSAYYKELSAERLSHALSRRGRGFKDYRVTFPEAGGWPSVAVGAGAGMAGPANPKLIIRMSADRVYADLAVRMGGGVTPPLPEGLHRYQRLAPLLVPGSRILEIAAAPFHTGYTAAWLASKVVPLGGLGGGATGAGSVGGVGGVVSITNDEQAAKFAARRYRHAQVSYEFEPSPGGPQHSLIGELDGAFDGIVCLAMPNDPLERDALMRELWRVLAPGGWMLAGVSLHEDPTDEAVHALRERLTALGHIIDSASKENVAGESPGGGNAGCGSTIDILLRKRDSDGDVHD